MVIIGSIKKSRTLKEVILQFLIKENFEFALKLMRIAMIL